MQEGTSGPWPALHPSDKSLRQTVAFTAPMMRRPHYVTAGGGYMQGCGGQQSDGQSSELADLSRVYCHGCFLDLAPSAAADGGAAEPAAGVVVRCPACRRVSVAPGIGTCTSPDL